MKGKVIKLKSKKPQYEPPRVIVSYSKEILKKEFKELKGMTVHVDLT